MPPAPSIGKDGFRHFPGAITAHLPQLLGLLAELPQDRAGTRIHGNAGLRTLLEPGGPIGDIALSLLGSHARPVRALLFDKSAASNWSLGWHQDRTIVVRRRMDVSGFGPWSMKAGLQHVTPPFDLLARMLTLRVHLDDVPAENAPLLVAPGSHRLGRVAEDRLDACVRQCGTRSCLAQAGDIWAYATPILHASQAAARPARRRVLQVDYAAEELPGGLEWLGV